MPQEVGTDTTRSDAPSVDNSLFGDTESDGAAEVVKVPNGQDSEDSGEQAAVGETAQAEDLKVVVSIKGERATIGVQRPSADPHIETFDVSDLPGLAGEVPAVTERARARWEDSPKHPAYERPVPPARRRGRRQQGEGQATNAEAGEAEQQQQTLRLF